MSKLKVYTYIYVQIKQNFGLVWFCVYRVNSSDCDTHIFGKLSKENMRTFAVFYLGILVYFSGFLILPNLSAIKSYFYFTQY